MTDMKVEITPEMERAGTDCLNTLLGGTVEDGLGLTVIPSDWAARVYRAMLKVQHPVEVNVKLNLDGDALLELIKQQLTPNILKGLADR